ncbi:MAG TPA: BACON domain-containing carbohydrate-binding protein, partial [Acidobacteriota bacterium]|nr:BACON domain-containing carbohydrate-binding protein [Acidobacteriota bacterium]
PRTGTLTIAGKTFTVDEAGASCTYALDPPSASFGGPGGASTATVTAPGGCAWNALSDSPWITFPNGSSGSGSGTLDYNVAANPDVTPRQGTITVEGQTLTIDQAAACLFCDDFEDDVLALDWNYIKPVWSETGGQLIGTPASRKAIAVATPAFSGCVNCSVQTAMSSTGGSTGRVWLLGWYAGKTDLVEVLMKEPNDKWVLKQVSGGHVVAKSKFGAAIVPGTVYAVELSFDGTVFHLSIDGVERIVMAPGGPVPSGTVGFQCRNTTAAFDEITVN